jgi:hypothetical protein
MKKMALQFWGIVFFSLILGVVVGLSTKSWLAGISVTAVAGGFQFWRLTQ